MALLIKLLPLCFLQLMLLPFFFDMANAQALSVGFYKTTCPSFESIVNKTTAKFISKAPTLAAPLLRMHFHDCFVRGCDGSVLINSTSTNTAEKAAPPNLSLRGFQVIDAVKVSVEKQCPGVASCADILALVARDAVFMIQGPFWQVPLGRRDGRISQASDTVNLPPPSGNITTLKTMFSAQGLSVKDLVVLSGGHTIGNSHCSSFTNRLYNFTGQGDSDPSMDSNYVAALKRVCTAGDTTTIVQMDPGSFKQFDTNYYKLITQMRGLFESDAALLNDNLASAYVKSQPAGTGSTFLNAFAVSMVKMGKIGVLTGTSEEIRKNCAFIN